MKLGIWAGSIYIYKVVQIWPGLTADCLHTNQSRSYLNHLVYVYVCIYIYICIYQQSTQNCCQRTPYCILNLSDSFRLASRFLDLRTSIYKWCQIVTVYWNSGTRITNLGYIVHWYETEMQVRLLLDAAAYMRRTRWRVKSVRFAFEMRLF